MINGILSALPGLSAEATVPAPGRGAEGDFSRLLGDARSGLLAGMAAPEGTPDPASDAAEMTDLPDGAAEMITDPLLAGLSRLREDDAKKAEAEAEGDLAPLAAADLPPPLPADRPAGENDVLTEEPVRAVALPSDPDSAQQPAPMPLEGDAGHSDVTPAAMPATAGDAPAPAPGAEREISRGAILSAAFLALEQADAPDGGEPGSAGGGLSPISTGTESQLPGVEVLTPEEPADEAEARPERHPGGKRGIPAPAPAADPPPRSRVREDGPIPSSGPDSALPDGVASTALEDLARETRQAAGDLSPSFEAAITRADPATPLAAAQAAHPARFRAPLARSVANQLQGLDLEEGTVTLRLKPQGMGMIEVEIARGAQGQLEIAMRVQNPMVFEALRAERPALADLLSAGGAKAESFSLDLFQPGAENQPGGRDRSRGEASTEKRTPALETGPEGPHQLIPQTGRNASLPGLTNILA